VISARGIGSMEIEINTKDLPTGVYSGSIDIFSKGINNAIPVRLNVISSEPIVVDNSYIIWYFTIGIVVSIAIITVLRYRKIEKKKSMEKQRIAKLKEQKKEFFVEPKNEYRTEYY
jgi:hypothetical protein